MCTLLTTAAQALTSIDNMFFNYVLADSRSWCHTKIYIVADMHMPLLLVPDHNSGACVRIGEGSTARHGVVHLSDPLLTYSVVSGVGISCLSFGFFVKFYETWFHRNTILFAS
ncbi:hypothetical protein VNO80_25441 [Phaseolus coccineus]|uniref:Uncharacterized protein n=1 Tax=Phaseolus coccineus TaxID=3886 RepID=A0AAN9LZ73_PHACN